MGDPVRKTLTSTLLDLLRHADVRNDCFTICSYSGLLCMLLSFTSFDPPRLIVCLSDGLID